MSYGFGFMVRKGLVVSRILAELGRVPIVRLRILTLDLGHTRLLGSLFVS